MKQRWRRVGGGLMTSIAVAGFGYQALNGEGMLRIASVFFLVMQVLAIAGAVLDFFRPRPKRRRSLEKRKLVEQPVSPLAAASAVWISESSAKGETHE